MAIGISRYILAGSRQMTLELSVTHPASSAVLAVRPVTCEHE